MQIIKNIIKKILLIAIGYDFFEKKIFLEGTKFAFLQKKILSIKNLSKVEFSVFSQWGDDGIINWLTNNLPIKNKIFVEIGTEDYKESNTRFLLKHKNWCGHLIEADKDHVKNIYKQSIVWKHDLKIHNYKVQKENINKLFKSLNLPQEIGLLSLDIDGIDYWVWKELNIIKPILFICEFNSVFGDKKPVSVPYNKNFNRTKFHYSNLAFGGSLEAFKFICKKKNYIFLGTNLNGVNAYFINKKYFKFLKNKIKEFKSFPSKARESRNKKYKKNFLRADMRFDEIKGLKLVDVRRNQLLELDKINNYYSKNWKF